MKTVDAGLQAHIEQTTTTLATTWGIFREDGIEKFYIDLDEDRTIDGDVYKAATGLQRTAIEDRSTTSPDTLDVTCLIDDDEITEEDLRAGLYDHAEVRIGIINYQNTGQGFIKKRRGWFGEVTMGDNGVFTVELLGMSSALNQGMMTTYQAECRADLGDTACGIPIQPDLIERSTAVAVGEFYRVNTLSPIFPRVWDNLLQNPSFELGTVGPVSGDEDLPGWSLAVGWLLNNNFMGASPDEYDQMLNGGTSALGDGEATQVVDLLGAGLDADEIDADNAEIVSFSIRRANTDTSEGRVEVDFLDEDSTLISSAYDSGWEAISPTLSWVTRSASSVAIPATTRYIRVTLGKRWVSGYVTGSLFDACYLEVSCGNNVAYSGQRLNENRHYEVTTAGTTAGSQPSYDTTIGNTTTDGTAVLTCRDAWMRVAEVETVIDQSNFTVRVSEGRAEPAASGENEWFTGGAIRFETGLTNLDRSHEIKSWEVITEVDSVDMIGQIELFRPLVATIYPGQQVRPYAGCDYDIDTCIDRFDDVENFRGEPNVPGTDALEVVTTRVIG